MCVNLIILYKQFNFGLVPSSNSLLEGQPHLFMFISPCILLGQVVQKPVNATPQLKVNQSIHFVV